jgi:hypothetical protein
LLRLDLVRRIADVSLSKIVRICNLSPQIPRLSPRGTAATLVGTASTGFLSPEPALAQSNLTPDEAMKSLLDGNERFVSGSLTSFDQDLKILRDHTVDKQEPFAAVLSCADSRVPPEILFDKSIGHIFVTRVAGNVVTPEIIGSLEYGAAVAEAQPVRRSLSAVWPRRNNRLHPSIAGRRFVYFSEKRTNRCSGTATRRGRHFALSGLSLRTTQDTGRMSES